MTRDEWFFRIKTATRALITMTGLTYEEAGDIAKLSKSQLHRCASVNDPELISISAAMRLEAAVGVPCVTEAMAAVHGARLVMGDGTPVPGCIASAFGSLAGEFGSVANRVAEAMADEAISPNEHQAICDALAKLIAASNRMKGTSASLRAVDEMRKAS